MKRLSDRALVELYDLAHAARVRTEEVEVTESLTGELMCTRALFDTFDRLTAYALEHQLLLRCDFGLNGHPSARPEWTVALVSSVPGRGKRTTTGVATPASATRPGLQDALRDVATTLGLMPASSSARGMH